MCRFGGTCLLLLLCFAGDIAAEKNNDLSLSELREQNNGLDATRQDLNFLVRPNMTQWEQLLLPAPTVVSLLGQMVVLSSKVSLYLSNFVNYASLIELIEDLKNFMICIEHYT
jgi:hypothetical protein